LDAVYDAILVGAAVALMSSVVAIGLTALQTLANPSGTVIDSAVLGMTAFGLLWLRNIKSS